MKFSRLILQDGDVINHHWQDCEDILKHTAACRADPARSDWGRLLGVIPLVIELEWFKQESQKDPTLTKMAGKRWNAILERRLADPEYAHLRSQPGGSLNFTGWRK